MGKQIEIFDTFNLKMPADKKNFSTILSDSTKEVKGGYNLICEVDATHAGTLINNRIYPPESMRRGTRTWTTPYKKPVLTNHDDAQDPIGRVIAAKYIKTDRGMKSDKYDPILRESDGYGYQRLTLKITDPMAIQKILDGRYETVSVRMSTEHCYCSICNQDWSGDEGPCDHTPGQKYEGKLAYMTTGDLSYREVSFVNIPADEFAGVKEAIIAENKDSKEVKLFASSEDEKVFADLSTGTNLYTMVDSVAEESDGLAIHLIEKSRNIQKIDKEEVVVNLNELTKDQLKDLDVVKELINEAIDASNKECEAKLKKIAEDCAKQSDSAADNKEDKKDQEEEKTGEAEAAPQAEEKAPEAAAEGAASEEPKAEEKVEEKVEEKPEEKTEEAAEEKTEEPSKDAKEEDKVKELEDSNKKMLDENVKLNSELHRMVAERLYDLKKTLRKPDVAGISTPDARSKKIEEFAQRSIDSLKDQIKDLLVEQESALTTSFDGTSDNPSIAQQDVLAEVVHEKQKVAEGKRETLTRLFPKAK